MFSPAMSSKKALIHWNSVAWQGPVCPCSHRFNGSLCMWCGVAQWAVWAVWRISCCLKYALWSQQGCSGFSLDKHGDLEGLALWSWKVRSHDI